MSIDDVLDLTRALVNERIDPVPEALRLAELVVRTGTAENILGKVLVDRQRLVAVLGLVSSLDHVGFLVPTDAKGAVSEAAAAAGFDRVHTVFPSMILARELGELAGCPLVPTMVLKACGETVTGAPVVVEVFMPTGIEAALVRDWIRAGVGPHVAFCVRRISYLAQLTTILEAEGFHLPAFMREKPLTNDVEKVTTVYFDGRFHGQPLRLEFCHYA